MSDLTPKSLMPDWWPKCPYPKSVFTMTSGGYVQTIPDNATRTAVSGYLMREGWCVFEQQLLDMIDAHKEEFLEWLAEPPMICNCGNELDIPNEDCCSECR